MSDRTRLEIATRQIQFARDYSIQLIDSFDESEWFLLPQTATQSGETAGVTHLAWQVGHITMAQYALTMIRVRGPMTEDREFISRDFFKTFKKGTTPVADASAYPAPSEIRAVFDSVYERALQELATYKDAELDEKLPEPHAVFDTKMGSVFFSSMHEMMHAGQIGLLRRMLGKQPIR